MKKIFVFLTGIACAMAVSGQETYLNNYLTSSSDIFGTARYVGMGGAMGALGADVSAIGSNPAAIGMMRRSAVSLTFGGIRQDDSNTDGESQGWASFDQCGFVVACHLDDYGMKYVNLGFNYQKKNNLTHTFIADDCGTSLLNHIGGVYDIQSDFTYINPVVETGIEAGLLTCPISEQNGDVYDGTGFMRIINGHTQTYDFNISGNYDDRVFWGLTAGIENLLYKSYAYYDEYWNAAPNSGVKYKDFSFNNYQNINGVGFNFKLGCIFRPIEDSPFRVGLAIETPTWYQIDCIEDCEYNAHIDNDKHFTTDIYNTYSDIHELTYALSTPWRFRVSAGYTIGSNVALGAEYEYADYSYTSMGYPDGDYDYYSFGNTEKDKYMNRQTRDLLQGVHAVKLGVEYKPISKLALRAGYNYYGRSTKKNGYFDPTINSYAVEFVTSTDYMLLGDVNIFTLGVGYSGHHFYADAAYKYRAQKADFYPYYDYYMDMNPATINLDRHQFMLTLGYKF